MFIHRQFHKKVVYFKFCVESSAKYSSGLLNDDQNHNKIQLSSILEPLKKKHVKKSYSKYYLTTT